jgi:thiosulfate reductase cytochrome b subunit
MRARPMSSLEKKFALAVRCCHWVNVPVLLVMLWSGLLIYWASPVYRIGLGSVTLFTLFPDAIFSALGVPDRRAEGVSIHFFFMWFFAINGLIYVAYTGVSGEYRELLPNRRSLREAIQVVLHDLGLSHVEPPPRKFNGAQQIAYTAVILMGAGSLSTGLAIYTPVQCEWLTRLLGGSEWARWEHFWLAAGYVVFFVIHVAQVARAGWGTFRAMVTGYDVVNPADRRDRRASGLASARPLEKRR